MGGTASNVPGWGAAQSQHHGRCTPAGRRSLVRSQSDSFPYPLSCTFIQSGVVLETEAAAWCALHTFRGQSLDCLWTIQRDAKLARFRGLCRAAIREHLQADGPPKQNLAPTPAMQRRYLIDSTSSRPQQVARFYSYHQRPCQA